MIGKHNYGTGRRKSSVARVFLKRGKGDITVNGRADRRVSSTRNGPHDRAPAARLDQPSDERSTSRSNVDGGGESGQAFLAVRHGITRALRLRRNLSRCCPRRAGHARRAPRS